MEEGENKMKCVRCGNKLLVNKHHLWSTDYEKCNCGFQTPSQTNWLWHLRIRLSWKYHWHWRTVELENKIRAKLGKSYKTSCANCGTYYIQDMGEHPVYEIHPDPWLLCPTCRERNAID